VACCARSHGDERTVAGAARRAAKRGRRTSIIEAACRPVQPDETYIGASPGHAIAEFARRRLFVARLALSFAAGEDREARKSATGLQR